ncbi:peptidoglycan DD-metalloendopeptidase family protein [Streptomyces sp. TRM43335]|uniref:Peptidoglycan DD-metalloendopeptidase family protein n=1 Tax=Streptomyces taklimakanensis TaxID=2569853 RepID=A0A6G2BAS6_9ACTN|nr:M23 family metallopeptidase [Streptomyces taklimakanensis]MTE19163.1 peptidoglycan DD-metalloendopeptidase family protein [Streptomyces taklimakanensis]
MAGRTGHRQWTPGRRGLVLRGAALAALGSVPFLAGRQGEGSAGLRAGHDATPAAFPAGGTSGRAPTRAATGLWSRPVVGEHRVTAPYGIPGNWQAGHHTGIDFAMPVGTPVYSVGPGSVVFAGEAGSYGRAVTIHMDDGHYTLFAHLSVISVREGQRVQGGSRVGSSGATGRVTGPHLHFEVRSKRGYGSDVDPVAYLARRGVRLI